MNVSALRSWRSLLLYAVTVAALGSSCARSAESWTLEGDRLVRADRLADAERAYGRALDRDPRHAPAMYGKGWALYASGHSDLQPAAQQLFQRAIDYGPDYYGGYRGRGVLLLEQGKPLAAERFLRSAHERAPTEATVLESLGQLYLKSGRLNEASQLFEAALAHAPERGELRRFTGDVALARGEYAEARRQLELGLSGSVSGRRGLGLLMEGRAMVELLDARRGFELDAESKRPVSSDALQALERADTLLGELEGEGFGASAERLRKEFQGPLLRSLQGKASQTGRPEGDGVGQQP